MLFLFIWMHVRPLQLFALALCMVLGCNKLVLAEEQADSNSKPELVYEVDPYYSDVGYNIPLTHKPVPIITSRSEAVIYRELIKGSLIPRYMSLEASIYPMPIMGTYIKSHMPDVWHQADVGKSGFNIIETFTAGFQEPWALSAFFGNVAKLKHPADTRQDDSYGYTGYLISAGTKHIKNNLLVADDWCEVEWKIKGKIAHVQEKLSWSFRVGGKFNRNHEVNNVTYINLHRSNTDLSAPSLAWLENTNFELHLHFLQRSGEMVRAEFITGKKMPLHDHQYIPSLNLGFIWSSADEYSGSLRATTGDKLTFVIRPSIEF